jgi:hypothetical protein
MKFRTFNYFGCFSEVVLGMLREFQCLGDSMGMVHVTVSERGEAEPDRQRKPSPADWRCASG